MRAMIFKTICFAIAMSLLIFTPPISPGQEKFFDEAPVEHANVRLVVFRPSVGTIKAVAAIQKQGFLGIPDLVVIGVYHKKEATDYTESWKYIKDNNLDGFHFHAVSADLSEDVLFKANSCTPEYEKIFSGSDGIIFTGGPDIPASVFKEKTSLLTIIEDPYRHYFEISAVFHLLGGFQNETFTPFLERRPEFPVLGICLGCQSLNVGTGGSLIQDIWSEVYGRTSVEDVIALGPPFWHNNPYGRLYPLEKLISSNFHRIKIDGRGKFCSALGFQKNDEPIVLSSHHQALARLGKGLHIIATSMDGKIVEAVEHDTYPHILGIQFHPEHPMLWEDDAQFRQTPWDKPFSFKTLLDGTPPSFAFNKAIWIWFGRKLRESRASSPAAANLPR